MKKTIVASFLLTAAILFGMTVNGSLDILGTLTAAVVNFGSSTTTQPNKTGTTAPGTCSVGQTFFDSDATAGSNMLLCTATNTWTAVSGGGSSSESFDPTDPSWMVHREEFMSLSTENTGYLNASNAWWFKTFAGSGMGAAQVSPHESTLTDGPGHPGQWLISTGATSNTAFWMQLTGYDMESAWLDGSKTKWKTTWVFKLGTTTQQTIMIGHTRDHGAFEPNSYLCLRHDPTTSAGNFFFAAGTYGGTTATWDTTVAADTAWHTFTMRGDDATASKVYMSLDGGTEHTFCASGCDTTATVTGRVLTSGIRMKTKEAVSKTLYLDYYGAKYKVNATTGVR